MKVLIDNGHGVHTRGKRSPDGRLIEAVFNRKVARELVARLHAQGVDAELLVPEDDDIPLAERCRRANEIAGRQKCILVSIHVNASARQGFHEANGWTVLIAPRASAESAELARILYREASVRALLGNRYPTPEGYLRGNLAILRDTRCPAVLTENMFMDNFENLEMLLSPFGFEAIVDLHVQGILKYLNARQ